MIKSYDMNIFHLLNAYYVYYCVDEIKTNDLSYTKLYTWVLSFNFIFVHKLRFYKITDAVIWQMMDVRTSVS